MKWSNCAKIRLMLVVFVVAIVLSGGGSANADFTFGTPTNLGPTVNSSAWDNTPSISADGLSLFFHSERSGGRGGEDIWVTRRATKADPWGTPVNLGPTVNTSSDDYAPSISADGLSLYYCSLRPGGYGNYDLWVTRRATTEDLWDEPVNLGSTVNGSSHDFSPDVSADGLMLYFASYRLGGHGSSDLWVTSRATTEDEWGTAVNLGQTVNSSADERGTAISADGLMHFFGSNRPGGYGQRDLWVTTRATANEPWGEPANLGTTVNSSSHDYAPSISADGLMLFFGSNRPGGVGRQDLWQVSIEPVVDFNGDGKVDLKDFSRLAQYWRQDESSVDIAPPPLGDHMVDFKDLAVLAEYWLKEFEEIVHIKWLGHASVKIWAADVVIYVDPRNLSESPHDATLVLVTHPHGDHYQPADIAKVSGLETQLIGPSDVIATHGSGQAIMPGQTIESAGIRITGVAAYNPSKQYHPKANNWLGFIMEVGSKRIYCAGDTDLTDEMKALEDIDVAILPVGGTYTMNAAEAAEAITHIGPELAIPYHWGDVIGSRSDAEQFAEMAQCAVKILAVGETISSENWPQYSPLIAHWKLDEEAGSIAYDSVGNKDGMLDGDPNWLPSGGKVGGALELDGVGDYVSTDFVLDPVDGAFSVFAWVKGGSPGQVVISQTDGAGTGRRWLAADLSGGELMTGVRKVGRGAAPLISEFVITDGEWHRVGLVWDGSYRHLYADDEEVAVDTVLQEALESADGGLYFGADNTPEAASFFSGLIDDIRIYNQAITP